jgi:sRNA-binding carbon storage regulator CsrA
MGLVIKQNDGDSYFIIANQDIRVGEYIEIKKFDFKSFEDKYSVREYIEAPKGFTILRNKLVENEGGIENVVQNIKEDYEL